MSPELAPELESVDQRSFGDLFRAYNEEMTNISFLDALQRIMLLALATLQKAHSLSDKVIQSLLDLVMGHTIEYWGLKTNHMALTEG